MDSRLKDLGNDRVCCHSGEHACSHIGEYVGSHIGKHARCHTGELFGRYPCTLCRRRTMDSRLKDLRNDRVCCQSGKHEDIHIGEYAVSLVSTYAVVQASTHVVIPVCFSAGIHALYAEKKVDSRLKYLGNDGVLVNLVSMSGWLRVAALRQYLIKINYYINHLPKINQL